MIWNILAIKRQYKEDSFENISKYDVSKNGKIQLGPSGAAEIRKAWQGLKHELLSRWQSGKSPSSRNWKQMAKVSRWWAMTLLSTREEWGLVQGKFLDELTEKFFYISLKYGFKYGFKYMFYCLYHFFWFHFLNTFSNKIVTLFFLFLSLFQSLSCPAPILNW